MTTYSIYRYYQSGRKKLIRTGMTLEEAKAWCSREDTTGPGWFDGFERE